MRNVAGNTTESGRPTVGPGETLDRLAGQWWIFQLRRGHRYATDDVLTAWTACRAMSGAHRLLDLGSGVGAIGLLVLLRMPPEARLTTVEVQSVSATLQRKTVLYNGLADRVEIREGDLRDPALLGDQQFDLVTANPPYLMPQRALRSPHPQRAAARMELNGDIFDFCRAAARWLAPGGRFCFSYAARDGRPQQAIVAAGLRLLSQQQVVFREGLQPTIALYTCGRSGEFGGRQTLTTRDREGRRTEAYRAVRVEMLIEA